MQTRYKNTGRKVYSIFPSLVWHATKKKKKKNGSNTKFEKKINIISIAGYQSIKDYNSDGPSI